MERHDLLAGLHARLQPRNYLEIGIDTGVSLALSRVPGIGIDPAFTVTAELDGDIQLVRATSDDYFREHNPTDRFDGNPLDFAFIDGMHLAEFALRDFIYVESYCARTSVVVFDDMLPRNVVEAARDRQTVAWTGDVFKVTHVLQSLRPDLVVLEVDTEPTGTVVVLLPDARSTTLAEHYGVIEAAMVADGDPQDVPDHVLGRTRAVDPRQLLACSWWETLVAERQGRVPSGSLAQQLAAQDWTELRQRPLGSERQPFAFQR